MEEVNFNLLNFCHISIRMEFFVWRPTLILQNRMVWSKGNMEALWKLVYLNSTIAKCPFSSGSNAFRQLYAFSIVAQFQFLDIHTITFSALHGNHPNYSAFQVSGCTYYLYLRASNSNKFLPWSERCVFLGYMPTYKGHLCYSLQTKLSLLSWNVIFDEGVLPFADHKNTPEVSLSAGEFTTYFDQIPVEFPCWNP